MGVMLMPERWQGRARAGTEQDRAGASDRVGARRNCERTGWVRVRARREVRERRRGEWCARAAKGASEARGAPAAPSRARLGKPRVAGAARREQRRAQRLRHGVMKVR
jgi:hypothetical protein